ncbi:MAG TPA: metal-dependent hydrolase [Vicinamibacterales bacterium]|nr:metal-dependent hydrolase [Vicinamibacterales bacterium]
MDPLTHTLTGACLAETGLKRRSPLAAATLIIAANLPDLDGTCYLHSADLAFAVRRGWSHGVLAVLLLPVLLTAAMTLVDRRVLRRTSPSLPPARPAVLLALSFLGVLVHVLMDWPNSYGVRLLTPFSGRWFYGDALFIADPWLWLVLGSPVMLSWVGNRAGVVAAVVVASGATLAVSLNPLTPDWFTAVWSAWIAAWLAFRGRLSRTRRPAAAVCAIVVAVAYIGAMIAGSRIAERQARRVAAERGWTVHEAAAMPLAAQPLRRDVIVATPGRYEFVSVNWLLGSVAGVEPRPLARGERGDPVVNAALAAPFVSGVRAWLRFPAFEVRSLPDGGRRVLIRDARFAVGTPSGYGVVAIVDLDRAGTPRPGPHPGR